MNDVAMTAVRWGLVSLLAAVPAVPLGAQTCDPTWTTLDGGINGVPASFVVFDDGTPTGSGSPGPSLYAGGIMANAGGTTVHHVARWNGATWSAVGEGFDGFVHALAVFDDGTGPALYAGGRFRSSGAQPAFGIAKWDGQSWSAVGGGVFFTSTLSVRGAGTVDALAPFDDGSGPALAVSGFFTDGGGVPAIRIARWDGSTWSSLGNVNGQVQVTSFATLDDGTGPALFAGGVFTSIGGVAATGIARWDGASWSAVGNNSLSAYLFTLTTFDDGTPNASGYPGPSLFAGGSIIVVNGQPTGNVARWNGIEWSVLGGGVNGRVHELVGADDGTGSALFVGGSFSSAGGLPASGIARWNGTEWSALGDGVRGPDVQAIVGFDDGRGPAVIVGGGFDEAGGIAAARIARWGSPPMDLSVTPLIAGQAGRFDVSCARPYSRLFVVGSARGAGSTPVTALNVILDLSAPRLVGTSTADAIGSAAITRTIPSRVVGRTFTFQAAHRDRKSNVVVATVQ